MSQLRATIESMLFVSEVPLSLARIKSLLPMYTHAEIVEALEALRREYAGEEHGFHLTEVAQGFQFRTKAQYGEWIRKLKKVGPSRLSRAALETLAIVAYKQPVLRSEIEAIRGVDVGGVLRLLLEKKLVKILGRKEVPGRPIIYGTTQRFLEVFGLKDLASLPSLDEIAPLGAQPASAEELPAEGRGKQRRPGQGRQSG